MKTLLIRDLSPGAVKALKRFKEERDIKTNTSAATRMMEHYFTLLDDKQELAQAKTKLELKYFSLHETAKHLLEKREKYVAAYDWLANNLDPD